MQLKDRKVIVIGERDGVPAPALKACAEAAGARVILAMNQCFV